MLLLTTERAPISLPSSHTSLRLGGTQETRWDCCSGQTWGPPEQECPQDSAVGFANQIANISLYLILLTDLGS